MTETIKDRRKLHDNKTRARDHFSNWLNVSIYFTGVVTADVTTVHDVANICQSTAIVSLPTTVRSPTGLAIDALCSAEYNN
jgi:hypothetical protein